MTNPPVPPGSGSEPFAAPGANPGWGQVGSPTDGPPPVAPPGQGFGQPQYPGAPNPYANQHQWGGPVPPTWNGPPLADFVSRLLALLIDSAITSIFSFIVLAPPVIAWIVAEKEPGPCFDNTGNETICFPTGGGWSVVGIGVLVMLLLILILTWLYFIRPIARTGQTLGKKLMSIRVVDERSGQPIGTGRSVIRYLIASFISGAIAYLGYLWMLFDDRNQTWHDKVASSIVIKE